MYAWLVYVFLCSQRSGSPDGAIRYFFSSFQFYFVANGIMMYARSQNETLCGVSVQFASQAHSENLIKS